MRDFWRGDSGRHPRRGHPAGRVLATCTPTTAARRTPRSTSSPPTTASRCATWCPTTSKHNEANGEDNRDGTDNNRSWNCGVEGETDDPEILALRRRQAANLMATLCLSNGVADDHRRRRARPHPARQQQRLRARTTRSPGSTGGPTTPGSTSTRSPRPRCGCGASTRRCASGTGSRARPPIEGGPKDLAWLHPAGREMTGGRLARRRPARRSACSSPATRCAPPARAASSSGDNVVPDLAQRRHRADRGRRCPSNDWVQHGEVVLSTDRTDARPLGDTRSCRRVGRRDLSRSTGHSDAGAWRSAPERAPLHGRLSAAGQRDQAELGGRGQQRRCAAPPGRCSRRRRTGRASTAPSKRCRPPS